MLSPRGQKYSNERECRWFVRRTKYVSKSVLYAHDCFAAKIQIRVQIRAIF
jgi:hypothetical protein